MNNFLQKYNTYKQRYLIVEADQQQTTLIRFLTTINSVRVFTDNLIRNLFNYGDITNIHVYDFNTDKIAENSTISISHVSNHGLYGYILRTNNDLINKLFNHTNKQIYYNFCSEKQINPDKRLKHTLPPTTDNYLISDADLNILKHNIEHSLKYLNDVIPNIIFQMVDEHHGIPFNEIGKCKVIVNDSITFGIFTEVLSPNHFLFDIGNVYPTLPRDYETQYKYLYRLFL